MATPSWLSESLIQQIQDMSSIIESPDPKHNSAITPSDSAITRGDSVTRDITDLPRDVVSTPSSERRRATPRRPLRARILSDLVDSLTPLKQQMEADGRGERPEHDLVKEEENPKPIFPPPTPQTSAQPTSPLDLSFLVHHSDEKEEGRSPGEAADEKEGKFPYNPDQMPGALFGLDPVYWSSFPLTTSTLRRLRKSPSEPSSFVLSNHPLRNVELCGFITEVKRWSNRTRVTIDDSHGAVGCVRWGEGEWEMEVGDLMTIRGALTLFREAIEIRVYRSFRQDDLNKLTVHFLRAKEQLNLLLTNAFVIPEKDKIIGDFEAKIKRAILSNILTNGAAESPEKFLEVPAMKMWTRSLRALTNEPEVASIRRIHALVSTVEQGGAVLKRQKEIRDSVLARLHTSSMFSVKDLEQRFKKEDLVLVVDSLISSGTVYECDDGVYALFRS